MVVWFVDTSLVTLNGHQTMGKLKKNVVEEAVHLLEEIRINTLLTLHNIPMNEPHKCLEDVKMFTRQLVEKGSIAEIILRLAGTSRDHHRSYWHSNAYWHPNSMERMNRHSNYSYSKLSHELEATLEAMYDYMDSNTLTMGRIKDLI